MTEKRIGDKAREATLKRLEEAFSDGEINQDELSERTEEALKARFGSELKNLTADLTMPPTTCDITEHYSSAEVTCRKPRIGPRRAFHIVTMFLGILWLVPANVELSDAMPHSPALVLASLLSAFVYIVLTGVWWSNWEERTRREARSR